MLRELVSTIRNNKIEKGKCLFLNFFFRYIDNIDAILSPTTLNAVISLWILAIAVFLLVLFTASHPLDAPASASTCLGLDFTEFWLVFGWAMAQRGESGLICGG